jgi:hypothetical protein
LLLSLKSFCCRKETCGYAKVIHNKKMYWKNGQVPNYQNNGYSDARLKKKREMNKIDHIFLQSCFQISKEIYVFKEHSRIRLATKYIHHTSTHMHILIWLYDLTLFGSDVWLYNICVASILFHVFFLPMNSTISLNYR